MGGRTIKATTNAYSPVTGFLTLGVGKLPPDMIQWLLDHSNAVIDVSLQLHKGKRSLNANAYFWVLVNEIAINQKISDKEVHDKFLSENIAYHYKDGAIDWKVADYKSSAYGIVQDGENYYKDSLRRVVLFKEDGTPYRNADGKPKTSKIFWHIKGTHEMNTAEMSRIIDSVVFEARHLGIKTKEDKEIERMIQQWEKQTAKNT